MISLGQELIELKKKCRYGKKDQPRTIVCKLLSYKDKFKVLQNCKKLKGSHIYINEEFCQATLQHRKELWKEVKWLREEKIILLIFSIVQMWSRIKTTYVRLTSFSCFNKVSPNKTKMTPDINSESMFFNPLATKECFVDNDHYPDVIFTMMFLCLTHNILCQMSLKQILRIFLKSLFPSFI